MRDSIHAGVAYGSLDYKRLTQCLRISSYPEQGQTPGEAELRLGVTHGGIFSAEALVMARHWMFSQVYHHRVRVLYDRYLSEFLKEMLGQGGYPFSCDGHLELTDAEVTVAMRAAVVDAKAPGHQWAKRIVGRQHHALLASFTSEEALRSFDSIEERTACWRGIHTLSAWSVFIRTARRIGIS